MYPESGSSETPRSEKSNEPPPLRIYHDYQSLPSPSRKLQKVTGLIYRGEKLPFRQQTSLVLCSDYKIKKLNERYRSKNKPTDVLSFNFNDPDLLGEIYISLQRAEIQARRYGISYEKEVIKLLIHGLFHLIGYDHMTPSEQKKMELKEQYYWGKIV